jgi:cyclic GMP-AMP synthase DncV-like protein
MSVFDCSKEMRKYHDNEVVLSAADQKTMRERRDNGRTRLESGLDKDGFKQPTELASQGSYAMRTMVEDPQCDYDIDDGAYFERADLVDAKGKGLTPREARERVCKALRHDERVYPAKVCNNCVRQEYAQGYHIDIPVYRIIRGKDLQGNETASYELASGDEWVVSDARKVTKWFNDQVGELNQGESDGSQMRRGVRYSKKQARSRAAWKPKTTSGIAITRLVVDEFVHKDGRDDESVYETWKKISARLKLSTRIAHPVSGWLAEDNDEEVQYFADRLAEALDKLKVLEDPKCTREQALKAWDAVFGTSFFSEQLDKDAAKAAIFVTSNEKAQRDAGDGRFG